VQPRFALYVFLSTYLMAGFGFVPHLLLAPQRGGDGLALAVGSFLGIILALAYGSLWRKAPYASLHEQLVTILPPAAAQPLAAIFGIVYLIYGGLAILFSTDISIRFLGAPAVFSLPVFLFAALVLYGSRLPFAKLLLAIEVLALLGILVLLLSLPPTLSQAHTRWDLAWRHLLRPGMPTYTQIAAAFVPFSGTLALTGFLHVLEPPKHLFPYALAFFFLAVAYAFLYLLPFSLLGPELLSQAPYPWLSAASAVRLYLSPMEQNFLTLVLIALASASLAATVLWAVALRLFETALFGQSNKRKTNPTNPPTSSNGTSFLGMRQQRLIPWLFLVGFGLLLLPLFWTFLGTEGTYRAAAMFFASLPAIELVTLLIFALFVHKSPQSQSKGEKRNRRAGLVVLIFGASVILASGCNYRDIEQHAFVIAVGIDAISNGAEKDKGKHDQGISISSDAVKTKDSELEKKQEDPLHFTFKVVVPSPEIKKGENRFLLLETDASAFAEAAENLRTRSTSILDFSHLNIVVIGEEAFKHHTLGELLDGFFRREEIKASTFMAAAQPTAHDILAIKPPDERIPGSNLSSLFERTGEDNPALYPAELYDVGRRLLEPGFDPVLPIVSAQEQGYRIDSLYVCDKTRPRLELRGEEAVILNALLFERVPLSTRVDGALLVSFPGRWHVDLTAKNQTLHLQIRADVSIEENPRGIANHELEAHASKVLEEASRKVLKKIVDTGLNPFGIPSRADSQPQTNSSSESKNSLSHIRNIQVVATVHIVNRGNLKSEKTK